MTENVQVTLTLTMEELADVVTLVNLGADQLPPEMVPPVVRGLSDLHYTLTQGPEENRDR